MEVGVHVEVGKEGGGREDEEGRKAGGRKKEVARASRH